MSQQRIYSIPEEVLNATTHGIGVGLGITALVIMTIFSARQHDAWKIVSSVLFGCSIILLYLSSTLYHSLSRTRIQRILKTLDHSSIFILIAGTYTPFCLVSLRGDWGWTLFGLVWGLALFGLFFKLLFIYRFHVVSMMIYLLMGWAVVIAFKPLIHDLPFDGLMWLMAGGLCYTLGVIFYAWKSMPFTHSLWHLFVLAGTICHFFAVLFFVI